MTIGVYVLLKVFLVSPLCVNAAISCVPKTVRYRSRSPSSSHRITGIGSGYHHQARNLWEDGVLMVLPQWLMSLLGTKTFAR